MRRRTALFLDRDGVLNEPVWDANTNTTESPLDVSDVILAEGAADAVGRANAAGLPVIVISNQPSAAKGAVAPSSIQDVHARVLELLAAQGAVIDHSYLCLHHPAGSDPTLAVVCGCRKPAPGLLQQAATELDLDLSASWMIGDTDADLGAARAGRLAGVILIEHPMSAHRRTAVAETADGRAATIAEAMTLVLGHLL